MITIIYLRTQWTTKKLHQIELFIKKDDAEGKDFYYIGKMITDFDSKEQSHIQNEKGQKLPIVNIRFDMETPVPQNLYNYLEGA